LTLTAKPRPTRHPEGGNPRLANACIGNKNSVANANAGGDGLGFA